MIRILVVDDLEMKVAHLRRVFSVADPEGKCEIVLPITPRTDESGAPDDRATVLDFLNRESGRIKEFKIIFQDKNLAGVKGAELVPEYRKRGYDGPIILYTASHWNWYQDHAPLDKQQGFTDVFPWGDEMEREQIAFVRRYLHPTAADTRFQKK
jgi:hypothetical protein